MTAIEGSELSTLALDVYWASGRPVHADIERHLRACARCRAYLAVLDASLPQRTATPLVTPPRVMRGPVRAWRAWTAPAAAAMLALAAVVALISRATPTSPAGYVGIKGTPAVQLLLHRGIDTHVWDGSESVHPGDALAVRVACEGMSRVSVATLDHDRWERLSEAPCPHGEEPLPFTLVVDGEPGSERLAVVLSEEALDDARLRGAIAANERTTDVWVVAFLLTKDTGPDR
jgi:hypothetical protein